MRQNRLLLDRSLVAALIENHFGNVDGFVAEWEQVRPHEARERAAVYKWLTGGIPAQEDALFGFCGALDVDPVAIIDYEKIGFFSKFYHLRKAIQFGISSSGPIPLLLKMFGPSDRWPSDWLAQKYFNRSWNLAHFDNFDFFKDNMYALVEADFSESFANTLRVIHISYRRTQPQESMWRPYGWVIQGIHETRLYSEAGDFQTGKIEAPSRIQFRTFFGERRVEFRVASLHQFSVNLRYPVGRENHVGFEW